MRKNWFENFLFCSVIVLLISIVGLEVLNNTNSTFTLNEMSKKEDTSLLTSSSNYKKAGVVSMSVSTLKGVRFLVNGQREYNSSTKDKTINLAIADLDVVEIDLRRCKEEEVSVYILAVSDGIKTPLVNQKYVFSGGINKIFRVKMK